ncbi:MAG: TolC family protein [Phenylobacterium sp.]|uniref:TolC family protein n=1 Tax=Phenylobacterium sp. TaxID=1871053 RepID=UPI0025D39394|nr:TolC family protein [Phenylobacterium sp.]MBT9470815.1 TolC family protein [Phenylobacterium sp.]
MKSTLTVLLSALSLSACASYAPAPIEPSALAAEARTQTLNLGQVRDKLASIAPDATWYGPHLDRLALFAGALLNNRDIAAARAGVDTAQAAAKASRVGPAATLTLSAEYARNAAENSPWLFGGAIDIPLDVGARRKARLTSFDLAVDIARYDHADKIWSVRMAVRRALADYFIAERQAVAYQHVAQVRARQQAAMENRVNAGEASRAELERVRADGADAVRRAADAVNSSRAALQSLATALGVPVEALNDVTLSWTDFDRPADDPGAGVTEEIRTAATLSRADVLKAVAAYDQAESDLRAEAARQYPAISIAPGYTWERGLVKIPVSLGLVLPPLDLNRGAIATAKAKRTEAGRKLEAVVAGSQAAIDAALAETRAARDALRQVRNVELVAAGRLSAQADRELAQGAIDRTDWAAAQAGAGLARISELDALARVHAADAGLEDALRRPLEGPETMILPSPAARSRP